MKEKLNNETFKKYMDLIDNNNWAILENKFVKEFCRLQGQS